MSMLELLQYHQKVEAKIREILEDQLAFGPHKAHVKTWKLDPYAKYQEGQAAIRVNYDMNVNGHDCGEEDKLIYVDMHNVNSAFH